MTTFGKVLMMVEDTVVKNLPSEMLLTLTPAVGSGGLNGRVANNLDAY